MKPKWNLLSRAALMAISLATLAQSSQAQIFTYRIGDLTLGFRKTGIYQENNEVVVNIGQASNYLSLAIGTTIPVPGYLASQQLSASFSSLNNLQWSVVGDTLGAGYAGYPRDTLWLTVPRSDPNVQSTAPLRLSTSIQQACQATIGSIASGAKSISTDIAVSNLFNTPTFVQESIATYPQYILTDWMGSIVDPTIGTLQDTWTENNLEITTPSSFSGSVVSDLYEVRPLTDSQGNPIVDPHTGTNGPAYYVGYFQFNSDGTMTFTRDAGSVPLPPPPPQLSITRIGTTTTISFGTTNGAVYTLYYTNSAGLRQSVTNWPSLPTTVTGNGSTNSIVDTSSDPNRFYRVGAH